MQKNFTMYRPMVNTRITQGIIIDIFTFFTTVFIIVAVIVIMTIATFCLGFVQILSKPLVLAFAGETELGILTTVIALGMMAGRGNALLILIAGMVLAIVGIIVSRLKSVKTLERRRVTNETITKSCPKGL